MPLTVATSRAVTLRDAVCIPPSIRHRVRGEPGLAAAVGRLLEQLPGKRASGHRGCGASSAFRYVSGFGRVGLAGLVRRRWPRAPKSEATGDSRHSEERVSASGRFLLHLSDTHLVGGPGPLFGAVDSEARLRQIVAEVTASGIRPDAMVFTGELADQSEPESYRTLRAIVEPVAGSLDIPVIWAMGNHDIRETFREFLLGESPSSEPLDRCYDVKGLRVLTLDTTVPGRHHGELSADQLTWLSAVLRTPARHGTILAMHHPPVPCALDLAVLVELRDQPALAAVLKGSDVRAILAGHLHYATSATFAGIPVSVASATCYTPGPDGAHRRLTWSR